MNIVTLGLGSTPSGVILLGYHWGGAPAPADESISGGWLSPEQARTALRKIHRKRHEKARRAEELQAAIEEAQKGEEAGEPDPAAPVREIVERDTGAIMLPVMATLQDALAQLAWLDQQVAALSQRRMDDAVAVLLLTEW